jgi:hypothetical protein
MRGGQIRCLSKSPGHLESAPMDRSCRQLLPEICVPSKNTALSVGASSPGAIRSMRKSATGVRSNYRDISARFMHQANGG